MGCKELAMSSLLPRLDSLSLNCNKIKDIGVKHLASASFPKLDDLSLSTSPTSTQATTRSPPTASSLSRER